MKNTNRIILLLLIGILLNLNLTFASKNLILHSDTIDVLNYSINLNISDIESKTISGYTELSIVPKINNINTFTLDLLALEIDSVFFNNNTIPYDYNDTIILFKPTETISITDTFLLKIYYHGHPVIDPSTWGGFYFSSGYAFNLGVGFEDSPHNYGRVWYPCLDDFIDKATYDFHIKVKQGDKAICGGTLQSVTDNSDTTQTYNWILHNEISTYLSSVAVGNYIEVTDTFYGSENTIPINLFVYPNDSLKAVQSFANLTNMLTGFEKYFGPYKWERVGYVAVDFNAGAMEHATNIAYPAVCINGDLTYETLYGHELSHHWFGDLVTCKSAEDMWLNEGWAVYAESMLTEHLYGKEAFKKYRSTQHKAVLKTAHIDDDGYRAVYGIPHKYTYGTTVYKKGADVAHTLRGYLGDSLFFNAIKSYMSTYSYKSINTIEFRDFLSNYTSIDLTDFFDTWVFSPGEPHYSIDSFSVEDIGQNYNVTVYVKQKLRVLNNFANSNKVEISFMDNNWNIQTRIMNFSGEFGTQTFTIPINPSLVMMDMEEKISDATTDNYKILSSTGIKSFSDTYFTSQILEIEDSVFIRATHNWLAPDNFKTPISGIIISDNRYWNIEMLEPSVFKAKGKFNFDTRSSSGLDNELITNMDSLVLLYRKSTAENWRIIPYTKMGFTNGFIIVDSLMSGEYSFGMQDWERYLQASNINKLNNEYKFKVFPNPSHNKFTFEYDIQKNGLIEIFDLKGNKVYNQKVKAYTQRLTWQASKMSKGTYIAKLTFSDKNLSLKLLLE